MGHHSSIARSSARIAIAGAQIVRAGMERQPADVKLSASDKPRAAAQGKALARTAPIDATLERRAKAIDGFGTAGRVDHFDLVDADIDRAGQRPTLTRRFRDSHIDRALAARRITQAQWAAACWYRERHAEAGIGNKLVSNYDVTSPGAGGCSFGMPRTMAQAGARRALRAAHDAMPSMGAVWLHRVVVEDDLPAFPNGRVRKRFWDRLSAVLQPLAVFLRLTANV